MKFFCQNIQGCGQECKPKLYNYSFNHAFGTEVKTAILSHCCEAPLTNEFGREFTESEIQQEIDSWRN